MNPPVSQPTPQTKIEFHKTPDYRDEYANSVNLQVTTWDFQLTFGRLETQSADLIAIDNFSRVYISPQQAKAHPLQVLFLRSDATFSKYRPVPGTVGHRAFDWFHRADEIRPNGL